MQDKKLFSGARALSHHPLTEILPKPKPQQYNLRRKVSLRPKINTTFHEHICEQTNF